MKIFMQTRQIGFAFLGLMSIAVVGIQGCQQSSNTPDPAAGTIHQGGPGTGGSGTGTNSGDSGTNNGGPAGVNK